MNDRLKNTTIAPMLAGPAPRDYLKTYSVQSMRLLDGPEDDAAKAAAAAAAKAAADAAAADAATKAAADAAAAAATAAEQAALAERLKGMTDNEAKLLKEQMATKAKLKAAEDAATKAQDLLKAFEGLDPTKAKELLEAANKAETARKAAEEDNLKKAGEWDRLKAMMADQHKTELGTVQSQLTEKDGALNSALKTINDLTVGAAFSNSSFIQNETVLTPSIARSVYEAHFDVANGKVVAFDKPRGAKDRTQIVNASGDPVAFEDAIKKIVETSPEKDRLLRSGIKDGLGSRTVDLRPGQTSAANRQSDGPRGLSRIQASIAGGALVSKK